MWLSAIWNNKIFLWNISTSKASIIENEEDRSNLLEKLENNKSKPKRQKVRIKKAILMKMHMFFIKIEN